MSPETSLLAYLNPLELRVLGPLVRRLLGTGSPRLQRAIETTGPKATARMACVNALRIYAIALFALGSALRLAGVTPAALALYALAAVCMAWSFWCLYTVVGPEREFRHRRAAGPGPI